MEMQIEDLSQQAQMAAAEKFKTPDVSNIMVNTPSAVSQPIAEDSDEEVHLCLLCILFKMPITISCFVAGLFLSILFLHNDALHVQKTVSAELSELCSAVAVDLTSFPHLNCVINFSSVCLRFPSSPNGHYCLSSFVSCACIHTYALRHKSVHGK